MAETVTKDEPSPAYFSLLMSWNFVYGCYLGLDGK